MTNRKAMEYIPIIGLEIHVELKTSSKMFCSCSADYFGHKPNTHVCPVCLGLPGALPVSNKQAIEWCLMLGMALNCEIPLSSKFDRKNYFYPDLPKGYQISQYDSPFCVGGTVELKNKNVTLGSGATPESDSGQARMTDRRGRIIRIRRVHQEEDTGKLIHAEVEGQKVTLIDFNRSGVPLVEIVTEPEIYTALDAKIFLQKLQQLIRYLGISDCNMEKGSMRLEPNISLSPDGKLPDYKVEVKNINSFRFLERAIDYEIERQSEILEGCGKVAQETRGFDDGKMRTLPQRGKEEAQDYRYFPEPDIPPFRWENDAIEKLRAQIPELPDAKLARFMHDYQLPEYDATILTNSLPKADYFEEAVRVGQNYGISPKQLANVIINKKVDIERILPAQLIQMLSQKNQTQTMNEEELRQIIDQVILDNPGTVSDYKSGKISAVMFLVGQVMHVTKGRVKAEIIKKLLEEKL